jgi:hypothetical protein
MPNPSKILCRLVDRDVIAATPAMPALAHSFTSGTASTSGILPSAQSGRGGARAVARVLRAGQPGTVVPMFAMLRKRRYFRRWRVVGRWR